MGPGRLPAFVGAGRMSLSRFGGGLERRGDGGRGPDGGGGVVPGGGTVGLKAAGSKVVGTRVAGSKLAGGLVAGWSRCLFFPRGGWDGWVFRFFRAGWWEWERSVRR